MLNSAGLRSQMRPTPVGYGPYRGAHALQQCARLWWGEVWERRSTLLDGKPLREDAPVSRSEVSHVLVPTGVNSVMRRPLATWSASQRQR
ncbi:MAG TPA: hypothetical protein VEL31_22060 [Ktedonobacteraceae bacterium]|nr:hypothetical protein [Ktedonobacteraceae bacterium]